MQKDHLVVYTKVGTDHSRKLQEDRRMLRGGKHNKEKCHAHSTPATKLEPDKPFARASWRQPQGPGLGKSLTAPPKYDDGYQNCCDTEEEEEMVGATNHSVAKQCAVCTSVGTVASQLAKRQENSLGQILAKMDAVSAVTAPAPTVPEKDYAAPAPGPSLPKGLSEILPHERLCSVVTDARVVKNHPLTWHPPPLMAPPAPMAPPTLMAPPALVAPAWGQRLRWMRMPEHVADRNRHRHDPSMMAAPPPPRQHRPPMMAAPPPRQHRPPTMAAQPPSHHHHPPILVAQPPPFHDGPPVAAFAAPVPVTTGKGRKEEEDETRHKELYAKLFGDFSDDDEDQDVDPASAPVPASPTPEPAVAPAAEPPPPPPPLPAYDVQELIDAPVVDEIMRELEDNFGQPETIPTVAPEPAPAPASVQHINGMDVQRHAEQQRTDTERLAVEAATKASVPPKPKPKKPMAAPSQKRAAPVAIKPASGPRKKQAPNPAAEAAPASDTKKRPYDAERIREQIKDWPVGCLGFVLMQGFQNKQEGKVGEYTIKAYVRRSGEKAGEKYYCVNRSGVSQLRSAGDIVRHFDKYPNFNVQGYA